MGNPSFTLLNGKRVTPNRPIQSLVFPASPMFQYFFKPHPNSNPSNFSNTPKHWLWQATAIRSIQKNLLYPTAGVIRNQFCSTLSIQSSPLFFCKRETLLRARTVPHNYSTLFHRVRIKNESSFLGVLSFLYRGNYRERRIGTVSGKCNRFL